MRFVRTSNFVSHPVDKRRSHACHLVFPSALVLCYWRMGYSISRLVDRRGVASSLPQPFGDGTQDINAPVHIKGSPLDIRTPDTRKHGNYGQQLLTLECRQCHKMYYTNAAKSLGIVQFKPYSMTRAPERPATHVN